MKTALFSFVLLCSSMMLLAETTARPSLWFKMQQNEFILQELQEDSIIRTVLLKKAKSLKLASLNAYPAVYIDSSTHYLSHTSSSLSKARQLTVMVAYASEEADSSFGIWDIRNTPKKNFFLTDKTIGNGRSRISYNVEDKGGVTVNTSVLTLDKQASVLKSADTIRIGSADSLGFRGRIAEFVALKNISRNERRQWQTYLSLKYGASMRQDDYFSSQNDTLWHYKENELYSEGIAGIGRDDYFGFNQHQSQIAEDSVTIGIDGIYPAQSQHRQVLKDKDFLLWGHNGEGFTPDRQNYYYQDSVPVEIEARKWFVKPHFASTETYATVLQRSFKTKEDAARACMFINRSGGYDTWLSHTEIRFPDSISGSKVFFKNMVWDTDGDGGDYFSFGYAKNGVPFNNAAGQYGLSEAEKVFTEANWQPNPVVDNLYILYKLTRDAAIRFSVYSNAGVPVCQTSPTNKKMGYNETVIPMGHLISGTYTVYVHIDDMVLVQVIIKG